MWKGIGEKKCPIRQKTEPKKIISFKWLNAEKSSNNNVLKKLENVQKIDKTGQIRDKNTFKTSLPQ